MGRMAVTNLQQTSPSSGHAAEGMMMPTFNPNFLQLMQASLATTPVPTSSKRPGLVCGHIVPQHSIEMQARIPSEKGNCLRNDAKASPQLNSASAKSPWDADLHPLAIPTSPASSDVDD